MAEEKNEQQDNKKKPFSIIPDKIAYSVHAYGDEKKKGKRLSCCHRDLLAKIVSLSRNEPCYASNDYFAEYIGVKKRQIMYFLEDLENDGFIEKKGRGDGRRISPTQKTRRIWQECLKESAIQCTFDGDKKEKVQYSALGKCNTVQKESAVQCTHNRKENREDNNNICANDDLRTSSPSHSANKSQKGKSSKKEMFDELWAAWPYKLSGGKRVRPNKAKAEVEFYKIKNLPDTFPLIMQAVERQKALPDWQKEGGKFIPHLFRWLRDKRWQDEIEVQPPAGPSPSSSWGGRSAAGEISEAEQRARDEAARRAAGFED